MTQTTFLDTIAPALPVAFAPGSSTSKAAADKIAPSVGSKRERVLALFRTGLQLTADEVAEAVGEPLLWARWRPRVSECVTARLLEDTGETRPSAFGSDPATVWRMANQNELARTLRHWELAAATATTAKDAKEAKAKAAWVRRELEGA